MITSSLGGRSFSTSFLDRLTTINNQQQHNNRHNDCCGLLEDEEDSPQRVGPDPRRQLLCQLRVLKTPTSDTTISRESRSHMSLAGQNTLTLLNSLMNPSLTQHTRQNDE